MAWYAPCSRSSYHKVLLHPQVGELLLQPPADLGGAPPLLPALAAPTDDAADSAGELLFGPLAAGGGASVSPEADRWQVGRWHDQAGINHNLQ